MRAPIAASLLLLPGLAHAGGLVVPGSGPVSTGRAGAAVASVDDPAAIGINPAGLAKTHGTVIHVGSALIAYHQTVGRLGTYEVDNDDPNAHPWNGDAYPSVSDTSSPVIGLGPFQAVPVIAVSSDLGGKVKGLVVAAGVFAPNAYPVRNMQADYVLEDPNTPPPPTRYDTIEQKAAVVLPSIAVAYHINKKFDVGARFSAGFADLEARTYVWGLLNYSEWAGKDGLFHVKVKDNFVPAYGLGGLFRPTSNWEIGLNFQSMINVAAKGTGDSITGSGTGIGGNPVTVIPIDGLGTNLCEAGGTAEALKACVNLSLPMMITLGGRYVVRDDAGRQKWDIELDVQVENWAASSDYEVIVDGFAAVDVGPPAAGLALQRSLIRHNLQNTQSTRLGGSYSIPMGKNELTLRGGIAYDTAAAKPGWQRADFDGAARTTAALGASFAFGTWRVDVGGGLVYEGTRAQGSYCNPESTSQGCGPNGERLPNDQRIGPDPTQPTSDSGGQAESPFTYGSISSGYDLLMLGVTKQL
jgi:long-subunit fatty acid transport protein